MQNQAFAELADNAFDFLRKALAEFSTDPKHSVINFYSGVELILKARLLLEHWTLVVAKETSRTKFDAGDFQSITFETACVRLEQVLGSPLPSKAKEAFDAMRQHRNRMVHFHHSIQSGDASTVNEVAAQQLRAWHWLHELISSQWVEEFSAYHVAASEITDSLTTHKLYIKAAFENLSATLEALKADGVRIVHCPLCNEETTVEKQLEPQLSHMECRICGHYWNELLVECEECGHESELLGGSSVECHACTHVMYADDIFRQIARPGTDLFACSGCKRERSVIFVGRTLFCIGCAEVLHRAAA